VRGEREREREREKGRERLQNSFVLRLFYCVVLAAFSHLKNEKKKSKGNT